MGQRRLLAPRGAPGLGLLSDPHERTARLVGAGPLRLGRRAVDLAAAMVLYPYSMHPRRSASFYRFVLALPVFMLTYLWLSGRATSYWHAFVPTSPRSVAPASSTAFETGLLWLVSISPLIFAAWEIGRQHTAARRLDYGLLVGLREVVLRAVGRDSVTALDAREAAFSRPPRDNPVAALALAALVAIGVPVFFASFSTGLRTLPALVWLIGAGLLMGAATYCRRRAMAYLRDEPGRWDVFGQWRLLNPARYESAGHVFVRWQIVATVLMPIWWLGGAAVLF